MVLMRMIMMVIVLRMIKMTFQGVINTWLKRDYKIQAGRG